MKTGQKLSIKEDKSYYMTMTVVNWVDVFTRKNHRDVIINALNYCQKEKGLVVFAYVIMSNHIHMIANTKEGFLLKDAIRDFKQFTSKKILFQIQNEPESRREWMLRLFSEEANESAKHTTYKFWQAGNHAIELFSEHFVWEKLNYIHNNPVTAGLVKQAHEWVYSSASNYQDMESVLAVHILPQRMITF